MTHLMQGEAIHFHVCLAHNDLHDDYLGDNDDDNDTKSSHSSCRTVTRFSQTQLERLLTVRHDDYLLFMKRKWIVINVFILMVVTLRTQGGGWGGVCLVCHLRGGRGPAGGGGRRRGQRGRHTRRHFTEIRCNFCLTSLLSISLKGFLRVYGTTPSPTICFSFSARVIEGPCHKRRQKQS